MTRTMFATFLVSVLAVLATSLWLGAEAMVSAVRESNERLEKMHIESQQQLEKLHVEAQKRDREALEKVHREIKYQWQLDRRAESYHRREERKLRMQELEKNRRTDAPNNPW